VWKDNVGQGAGKGERGDVHQSASVELVSSVDCHDV
jgi:hypothetical protein